MLEARGGLNFGVLLESNGASEGGSDPPVVTLEELVHDAFGDSGAGDIVVLYASDVTQPLESVAVIRDAGVFEGGPKLGYVNSESDVQMVDHPLDLDIASDLLGGRAGLKQTGHLGRGGELSEVGVEVELKVG